MNIENLDFTRDTDDMCGIILNKIHSYLRMRINHPNFNKRYHCILINYCYDFLTNKYFNDKTIPDLYQAVIILEDNPEIRIDLEEIINSFGRCDSRCLSMQIAN